MIIETKMCHSSLVCMLMQPAKLQCAIHEYTSSCPDVDGEGFNRYMETVVKFKVKDLKVFTDLYESGYKLPSDRCAWYYEVKDRFSKEKE